jgi:hypothetical protein
MKLRPTQIVGLVGIVVFGSYLAWRVMQPERDPMILPSGVNLRDLPSPSALVTQPDIPVIVSDLMAVAVADPLDAGSQEAKDDLYCSGVVFAVRNDGGDPLSAEAQQRRDLVILLAEAGVKKLVAEGVATLATTAPIADAHAAVARADHEAGTLRIPVEACLARGEAANTPPASAVLPPLPPAEAVAPQVPPAN